MTAPTADRSRTRLAPEERRAQLLDLGVDLLGTRTIEELSVDVLAKEAGISRGLLYHYFGSKQGFRKAVVQRAVADLIEQTAPVESADMMLRLQASVRAYVDYVDANYQGYVSIVRGAAGGDPELREIYDATFAALGERFFDTVDADTLPDTAQARLIVRGWQALAEEMTIAWKEDPRGITKDALVDLMTRALPALVAESA